MEKLRQFVKAPPWLQARASAILTAILTNADRNGLIAVLHGYLDGIDPIFTQWLLFLPPTTTYSRLFPSSVYEIVDSMCHGMCVGVSMGSPQSITLQQQVAVLVSSAPRAAIDKVDYFRSICQQLSAAIASAMRTDDLVCRLSSSYCPHPDLMI